MTWNWSEKKKATLVRRKPAAHADGENSQEVVRLAEKYMRRGMTRQRAYALARKNLKQSFGKRPMKKLRGGSVSPK